MRTYALPLVAALALAACTPHDPRLPAQTKAPTVPNAPAPVAPATPMPAPATPSAPRLSLEELGDGKAEAKALLENTPWDDADALGRNCDRSLARAQAHVDRFHAGTVATDGTLKALDDIALELDTVEGYASLMFNVSPVKEMRDTAETCREKIARFATTVSLDRTLYDALAKVPLEGLDAPTRHFAEQSLRDFHLAGVDKDDAARKRIAAINEQLVKLSQDFQKNVNGDTRSIQLDPKALAGLPDDWVAAHPVKDGKVTVTTDYPDLVPFLTYATDAAARKALTNASAARGYPVNADVLKQVLTLRQELAKLVGFDTFAALDLADKMAGTPETVDRFIADAHAAAKPRIDADLAELLARKRVDDPAATTVEVEDRFYLMQLVRKEKYGVDAKVVREFFPYRGVRDGIFALYGELFGIQFARRDGVVGWHPDTEAWEVSRDGKVIGRFFLDMHPRPDKYKHAAMFPIQTGLVASGEGEARLPWASLVCNFPSPNEAPDGSNANNPALMEHKEVVTFFHEFGHLIHHLLAQESRWISTSGINVEWDFVEAPSQLLEEWAWDPDVLARFAKNAAGKTIPKKLVAAMRTAEELGKGVELARQLFYAAYSFYLHQADAATLDLEAFTSEMYTKWSPYPRPADDHVYANFAHLIGYKSAYYTYQWSLAIAKDLFGRFAEKGLLDPTVAADYRTKVLEPGGTAKAEALVRDFLGRERNLEAYRAWITK